MSIKLICFEPWRGLGITQYDSGFGDRIDRLSPAQINNERGVNITTSTTVVDAASGNVTGLSVTSGATDSLRPAGTYNVTTYTTDSVGGTALELEVTVDGGGSVSLSITDDGRGFAAGDSITIANSEIGNGSQLNGVTVAADGTDTSYASSYAVFTGYKWDSGTTSIVASTGQNYFFDSANNAAIIWDDTNTQWIIATDVDMSADIVPTATIPVTNWGTDNTLPTGNDATYGTAAGSYTYAVSLVLEVASVGDGLFTGLTQKSTSGSGTNIEFTVGRDGAGAVTSAVISVTGSGYETGDTIVIDGADIGGVTVTDDVTLTLDDATGGNPYGVVHFIEAGNHCSFVAEEDDGNDIRLYGVGLQTAARIGNGKIRGRQKVPAELQSISIDINPSSDELEAKIYSIDSTNSIVQLSDIKDIGTDQYPNDSEFSDNDVIEIITENDEVELAPRVRVVQK